MKRRFFQIVLLGTIVLGSVLAYSLWKAAPATTQSFFESGKKYYEAKKYSEAAIQFLNAVRKDPKHRDSRYFLALTYMSALDFADAGKQLKALLEYYPDDIEANLQLGGIYLLGGRTNPDFFRQAQQVAANILAKQPQNVNALILSGNASAGLQDYHSSVDLFEQALSVDPQNISAFVSLGTSQALQKNYPEAEQAFLKAREISPKEKGVLVSLANYYRAVHDANKAEAVFKDALSMYPGDRQIYIQLVDFYSQSGRVDDAAKLLADVQARNAQNPEPSLILADLYVGKGRLVDARKILTDLKQKFPKDLNVAAKLALNLMQDQPDRARVEIDQILKTEPKNVVANVLLGEAQFLSGQYDAAEATLGKAPAADSPFPQPHFFLGNIAMRKGLLDQAIFHYQKSLDINSKYVPARVALAEVFLNKGRIADSREQVRKALDTQSDFAPARLLQATLDRADKKYPEAEQELTSLLKDQPENAAVYRQMALYYESRGKTAEAEKDFVHALALRPDSQELLRDVALFYVRTKQPDLAIQKINAVPDDKKQAFHYELLGIVYSQAGKREEAESAYKKAIQKDPKRTSADVYLFSDYMKSGRVDDGLKQLDEVIKKNPSDKGAYTVKGSIYEGQGKIEEAKQNYMQALKIDPNSEFAANNLAWILAEEGKDLNTALTYAQKARQKQPENPSIADTLGWVYYRLGNYVLAREQTLFAVSKQPDNGVFLYHLAMIYKETKQIPEAQSALKKAVSSSKDFKEKSLAQAALKEMASLR